jgi:hypothetical protein
MRAPIEGDSIMGSACAPTKFSLNMDGKYHDATFIADGDSVAVIYWAPQGVVRLQVPWEDDATPPEQIARELLSQMIQH